VIPSASAAIFAVAAARLGMNAGFIGAVGKDGFGRLVARRLGDEQVDISCLHEIQDYTTGIAFIAYTAAGGREFVFHLRQSAAANLSGAQFNAEYFAGVSWLHLSGSALFLSDMSRAACARALEMTKQAGGKLSLDPNLRPELMAVEKSRDVLAPYLAAADLLLPTAEEAHLLTGCSGDEEAAASLMKGAKRIVAIKRGAAGASLFTADGRFDIPGFAVTEVDPTGAGDCFNAGFIYGLEMDWPAAKAGVFASAAGALAVTQQGPMEGAPRSKQVNELVGFINSS
jgi:sugar/nucleoside kinase (ribokinase family)